MKKNLCLLIFTFIFCQFAFAQDESGKTPAPEAAKFQSKAAETETEESETKKYNVQLNYSTESLSRNLGVWKTASLYFERKLKNRQLVWVNYRLSDRNSTRDQEFVAGTYKPLKKRWAFTTEAMYSPTRKYVGKYSVMGEVEKGFNNGIVVHGGSRYTAYTTVKATTGYGLVEKYWGSNRAAYTLYITKLTNAGTAPTHRLQYNRYYGERTNNFGLAVSVGREHESLGPSLGVLRSKTWSVSLSEKHWLTKNFAINVNATIHRQGKLYYRRGLNFGFHYRF